jgi:UDP-glucose 4-epimerase
VGATGDLTVSVGRAEGVSVRELVTLIGEVTGDTTPAVVEARRPGDAPRAVASAGPAERELGWTARRGMREMVESAWQGRRLHHPESDRRRAE